jgi:hypothetical protein
MCGVMEGREGKKKKGKQKRGCSRRMYGFIYLLGGGEVERYREREEGRC